MPKQGEAAEACELLHTADGIVGRHRLAEACDLVFGDGEIEAQSGR
jgi:hypothetical protein